MEKFLCCFFQIVHCAERSSHHNIPVKNIRDTPKGTPYIFGGEGEIRTLEPCYRLHDFQSCALDQLGDFSKKIFKAFLPARLLYHKENNKSSLFLIFLYIFCRKQKECCKVFFFSPLSAPQHIYYIIPLYCL